MATISLTIPDAMVTRVQTALCTIARVSVSAPNAKQVIADFVKSTVKRYEAEQSEVTNDIDVS